MLTRRRANLLLLSATTLATLPASRAVAQAAALQAAAAEALAGSTQLQILITKEFGESLTPDQAASLADREVGVARNFLTVASAYDDATLAQEIASPEIADHLDLFLREKIPLTPSPETIAPLKPAPIADASVAADDTIQSILIAVFLDTVGLSELSAVTKEVVRNSDELSGRLDRIAAAIGARDWEQVYDLSVEFLRWLVKAELLERTAKIVGRDKVDLLLRRLLPKLAARAVPFIGWGLMAFAFVFSIKKNWPRIAAKL